MAREGGGVRAGGSTSATDPGTSTIRTDIVAEADPWFLALGDARV